MSLEADFVVRQNGFSLAVTFSVHAGQTLAVIGPNGSGKSTLLSTLAGHISIESGSVSMAGVVLDSAVIDNGTPDIWVGPEDRPLALVPQDGLLFPHLNVTDNVLFGLRHHKGSEVSKAEQIERCRVALDAVDLPDVGARHPDELSGGQAQRVAVARALVLRQPLLLLDEPLSRIDVSNRRKIRAVLSEHRPEGQVQVIVTHGADHAVTADLILAIEDGEVTAFDSPEILVAQPPTPWIAELLA